MAKHGQAINVKVNMPYRAVKCKGYYNKINNAKFSTAKIKSNINNLWRAQQARQQLYIASNQPGKPRKGNHHDHMAWICAGLGRRHWHRWRRQRQRQRIRRQPRSNAPGPKESSEINEASSNLVIHSIAIAVTVANVYAAQRQQRSLYTMHRIFTICYELRES